MKKIYTLIAVFLLLFSGSYLFYKEGTLPFNKNDRSSKVFVISKGQPLNSIINSLFKEDLIRNKLAFYLVCKIKGIDKTIQAGDFRLSASMNAYEIANELTHGTLDVWITLIEGTRKEEMAQIISKELNIPESEIVNQSTEGYLFPDTYLIPKNATAGSVISITNSNYESKFSKTLKAQALSKGLKENEVIILASLVEKEAKNFEDKKTVAGILLKRLEADWPLQIDATIQYALGYQPEEKTWWKKNLTSNDLKIDSPYNSYTNKNLPPGAICNPGLSSIESVINANTKTPYWYYISDSKGTIHFARTLEEHEANIEKYLR